MVKFISLGGNCSIAKQMRNNNINQKTLPFDWVRCNDFNMVLKLLDNNFEYFMDNLKLINIDNDNKFVIHTREDKSSYIYRDMKYNITFYHDFYDNVDIDEVKDKYRRRISRLYQILKSNEEIVFVRSDIFVKNIDINILFKLDNILKKINKNINYRIKWIVNPIRKLKIDDNNDIILYYGKYKNWWCDELDWLSIFS